MSLLTMASQVSFGPAWEPFSVLSKRSHYVINSHFHTPVCVATVTDFIFLGSKVTAEDDCSHEIKRHLLLGRKVMTNLDSILKSRDITLLTKVHLVKAMVFPVVIYGCESRTIKKTEHQRIDTFELWCWRRLLRVPWTARRSNQSILKEISPEYSLEGLMLRLKLQYFGHLMWRADSFEKTLMLGKIEGRGEGDDRGWDGWMTSPTQWTWVWVDSGSWGWTGRPGVLLWFMRPQRVGHNWATELNWTELVCVASSVLTSELHFGWVFILLVHPTAYSRLYYLMLAHYIFLHFIQQMLVEDLPPICCILSRHLGNDGKPHKWDFVF